MWRQGETRKRYPFNGSKRNFLTRKKVKSKAYVQETNTPFPVQEMQLHRLQTVLLLPSNGRKNLARGTYEKSPSTYAGGGFSPLRLQPS
jgi:hypothetical protein